MLRAGGMKNERLLFYVSLSDSGAAGAEKTVTFGHSVWDTAYSGDPFGAWLRLLPAHILPLGSAGDKGIAGQRSTAMLCAKWGQI